MPWNFFRNRQRDDRPDAARPADDRPAVPDDSVIYAIGDIHGRFDLLQELEARIVRDASVRQASRRLIICLGDYIDRGYQSREVVDHLLAPPPDGFSRICLKGNHEVFALQYLEDPGLGRLWFANGGREALMSYGVPVGAGVEGDAGRGDVHAAFCAALPDTHRKFFEGLTLTHREGDYLFVHAGVRPGRPLDVQEVDDLVWIREEFVASEADFGAVVVHGHTAFAEPDIHPNRIGVDTGAYATGRLTCLVLEGTEQSFLRT